MNGAKDCGAVNEFHDLRNTSYKEQYSHQIDNLYVWRWNWSDLGASEK